MIYKNKFYVSKEFTMKKIIAIFVLLSIATSQASAAFCSSYIIRHFTRVYKTIETTIKETNRQMNENVLPSAQETLANIKKENEALNKLIATQQAVNLAQEELIFNLEKKIQMRK